MNNPDLLTIFANDQRMILYRPEWRSFTGSVTATILLQQILYRWDKNGRKPFYKFKEPCSHDLYRDGDSWTEELGFCRKEFDSALKKIATKRTKKTEGATNSLVEYWTDINRITFYTINTDILQTKLNGLYSPAPEPGFTKSAIGTLQQKSQQDLSKRANSTLEYKQRLHTDIKNDVRKEPVKSEPAPSAPEPAKEPPSPSLSPAQLTTILAVLFAMIPEPRRKSSVKKIIEKAILAHGEIYTRQAISYALDNSNGGTWQNFKAYLGKTIDNGWGDGYEPDNTALENDQEKQKRFLHSRRQMPIEMLIQDSRNGCKTSQAVLTERGIPWER